MNPKDICEKKFEKSKVFGYKTSEVDEFMMEIFKSYNELYEERNNLEEKVNFLAEKLTEYREQENKLTDVLLEAKKVSDNVIKKAKEKSDIILSEAEIKSNKMLYDIKKEVEREQMLLTKLQRETSNFKNKIISLYKSHIDLIMTLPSNDINESQKKSREETIVDENCILDNYNTQKKMKEKTFSISLDQNGRPVEIKDDDILSDTKNISLVNDIKKVSQKYKINDIENKKSKFKEPLKFGVNYNLNDRYKKK